MWYRFPGTDTILLQKNLGVKRLYFSVITLTMSCLRNTLLSQARSAGARSVGQMLDD
jgi:hypothetical protein